MRQSLLARRLLFFVRERESLKEMKIDGILENMKKTIALILFAALTLSMISAGSIYLDSGISIFKRDRTLVFKALKTLPLHRIPGDEPSQ